MLNIQTDFLIESGICWSTSPNPTRDDSKTISVTNSGIFVSILTGLTQGTKYYVRAYALYGTVYDNGILYGNDISFTTKQVAIATLTTTAITNITTASAGAGGNVTSDGGSRITEWGVCWNTSGNPTTDNYKNIAAGVAQGSGIFMGVLPDLNQGTTYYVRAYAVNSEGTAYGNEISFSTLSIVTTSAIVSFSSTSAVVTGNVIYGQIGNHLIGSGVCWSTSHNPTTADSKTPNVTYSGIFTTNLTGLTQGTTYFVKAYAEYDNAPTLYGNELSFTTSFEQGTGTQKSDFPGGARYDATSFSIGIKVYLGLGTTDGDNILKDFWEWDQASNVWTRKADYPGNEVFGAVGFSIGTKGYIGTGGTNEFWEYDPATNSWTQKSSLPGTGKRSYAVGFSIGTKGYIGTGYMGIASNSDYQGFLGMGSDN